MSVWTNGELDAIGAAHELEIAPARRDGTLRTPTTIWVVRVGNDLYVRSWRGPSGSWSRAAQATRRGHVDAGGIAKHVELVEAGDEVNDAVDDAYRTKYGRYLSYVGPMVRPEARATTLRLVPSAEASA